MTAGLVDAMTAIGSDRYTLATPCTDWSLADLVDHVAGGNWYTVLILTGASSDDALAATMARFEGGSVAAAAAVESAAEQLTAFEQPGILEQRRNHVAGELGGRQILRLRLHDLIVHTWDINQTIEPGASVPAALADWGLAELREPDSLMAKHFAIPAGAAEDPAPDASPSASYLHAFGRTPRVMDVRAGGAYPDW